MRRDAIILVGGKGTRLASVVTDVAKPMASVDGRPFVDVIVKRLQNQGISRIIMATGHKAESVHDYYKDQAGVVCIKEDEPMGTGGAILNVLHTMSDVSDPFFVLNGDSFYPFELSVFDGVSNQLGAVEMDNSARYGTVTVDSENRIVDFNEKTGIEAPGLVSAGFYCLHKEIFKNLKLAPCFIEKDIFPALAAEGELMAVRNKGPMLDIGLPETYAAASAFLRGLE